MCQEQSNKRECIRCSRYRRQVLIEVDIKCTSHLQFLVIFHIQHPVTVKLCHDLPVLFIVNLQCDGDQSSIQHVFESQHTLSGEEWVPVKPAVTPLIPPYKGKRHYYVMLLSFNHLMSSNWKSNILKSKMQFFL